MHIMPNGVPYLVGLIGKMTKSIAVDLKRLRAVLALEWVSV